MVASGASPRLLLFDALLRVPGLGPLRLGRAARRRLLRGAFLGAGFAGGRLARRLSCAAGSARGRFFAGDCFAGAGFFAARACPGDGLLCDAPRPALAPASWSCFLFRRQAAGLAVRAAFALVADDEDSGAASRRARAGGAGTRRVLTCAPNRSRASSDRSRATRVRRDATRRLGFLGQTELGAAVAGDAASRRARLAARLGLRFEMLARGAQARRARAGRATGKTTSLIFASSSILRTTSKALP